MNLQSMTPMKTNTNNLVPILLLFLTLFFSCEQQEKEVAISSVSLNQPSAEMIIGETVQLTATISPSSATDKSIIWSSSKQSVATVSESGLVTAVAVGSTTITAAAGGKTGSCVITVSKGIISVDTIELNKTELFLYEEDEFVLEATIKPDNATDKSISWKSSNKDIASVDNNGRVVALKKGDAIITATANDGGKTARCLVSIIKHLSPSETIGVEHISAVSAILSGKANFETTVSADLMLGFQYSKSAGILPSNSTTIEVTEADADYNYSAVVKELEPNTTYYFRSFIRQHGQDTYGETKEFTTNDINSVLETGVSYNIEAKRACLKAKLDLTDVQYGSISYGFYWGRTETTLNSYLKGEEVADNSYTALVDNLSPVTQYWYKAYLKLDEQVFYGDVKTFTTNAVLVESVSLDRSNYTFNTIGSSLTLHATVLPSDASDKGVSWSSDSEEVATVDSNGKVTSVINGTATITVKTNDQGKTATCVITVAQRVTSIVLDNSTLEIEEGETQTLIATVNPDNAYDKTLTWTSLDDQIATVDSNGNVTAVSKGTTTIIATANDGSNIKASCTIIVREVFKAIDLGLSVRWANYNVGANSSEEFGDYFAWGEIEPYYTEGHAYDKNCTSWK